MDTTIPAWLQLLLGILPIPLIFKLAIEAAYLLWLNIPWFHKPAATMQLRKACRQARKTNADAPIKEWTDKWLEKTGQKKK